MRTKKKFSTVINVLGADYKVNLTAISYNGRAYYLMVSNVASAMKQIMNAMRKSGLVSFTKMWAVSESYSGGNSVRANLYGADENTAETLKKLGWAFSSGSFDGMTDMYEYKNGLKVKFYVRPDLSTMLDLNSKYIFTENRPPFGTPEYDMDEMTRLVEKINAGEELTEWETKKVDADYDASIHPEIKVAYGFDMWMQMRKIKNIVKESGIPTENVIIAKGV